MRGSSKILMAFVAMMILAAPLSRADDHLGLLLPSDGIFKSGSVRLVRFDGVDYRIKAQVPCELYFEKADDHLHILNIKPEEEELTAFCIVTVQWGIFAPVTLQIEGGGTNSWLINTETGYAEK
jgi:hypothetical protein